MKRLDRDNCHWLTTWNGFDAKNIDTETENWFWFDIIQEENGEWRLTYETDLLCIGSEIYSEPGYWSLRAAAVTLAAEMLRWLLDEPFNYVEMLDRGEVGDVLRELGIFAVIDALAKRNREAKGIKEIQHAQGNC